MPVEKADLEQALKGKRFWHLATINPDGSPHVAPVWADTREGKVVVNSAVGRVKDRNLARDPRVALSATDPENPYEAILVRGRVVDVIEGDVAENDIDELARKYIDQYPYPWRSEGERRITYLIEPERISG